MAFEARVERWAKAHPTAAQRLAQLERERANAVSAIRESANHAMRTYGISRGTPAAPPAAKPMPDLEPRGGALVYGPFWDRFARR